ncbi:MAG: hypothetical protein ACTTH0_04805 [Eubacteriales bacterium]
MKGYIRAFALFITLVFVFSYLLTAINEKTGTEREKTLKEAVRKASVQCYAIEGRYPSSVDYLEENYGLQIDKENYAVFYEGFASNVMPSITVVKL